MWSISSSHPPFTPAVPRPRRGEHRYTFVHLALSSPRRGIRNCPLRRDVKRVSRSLSSAIDVVRLYIATFPLIPLTFAEAPEIDTAPLNSTYVDRIKLTVSRKHDRILPLSMPVAHPRRHTRPRGSEIKAADSHDLSSLLLAPSLPAR